MKSYPNRFRRAHQTPFIAGAFLALAACQMSAICSADDTHIDTPVALKQLHELALAGKSARVVLQKFGGGEVVLFARVGFSSVRTNRSVAFGPHFTRRPNAERTLAEEYLDEKPDGPLTDSREYRELAERTVVRLRDLEASEKVMVSGNDRYLVKSIDELNMSGPSMPVAMNVKALKLLPDDPWIGNREGEPSNWVIEYTIKGLPNTIKGFPKPFCYRIPFHGHPQRAPIDSVTVHPAAWQYRRNRERHVWGILFEVREGAKRPYTGFFELDDYGYPVGTNPDYFDKELLKHLTPWHRWALWIKNHEFTSEGDAWDSRPKTSWNRQELAQIVREILESTQNPDIRLQVLGVIRRSGVIDEKTVRLVKRSLDSPYEAEVSAARSILDRHAKEKARGH